MCVLCIPNVSAGRCFCSEIPRKIDAAKIETFCEVNALERLEGFDAGGRWAPGSGDGETLSVFSHTTVYHKGTGRVKTIRDVDIWVHSAP